MKHQKSRVMKQLIFFVALLSLFACKDQVDDLKSTDIQFAELKEQNMKIIPANPTINDEIRLLVFGLHLQSIVRSVQKREYDRYSETIQWHDEMAMYNEE